MASLADTPWHHTRASSGVLACAGYVQGDQIINRNLPWPVFMSSTRERLGMQQLVTINDFAALAYAVPFLSEQETKVLYEASILSILRRTAGKPFLSIVRIAAVERRRLTNWLSSGSQSRLFFRFGRKRRLVQPVIFKPIPFFFLAIPRSA